MSLLPDLFGQFPQPGHVEWIGVRPQREGRLVSVREVRAIAGAGLQGDHYAGGANGKRHLTLIQHEHLAVVARLLALRDNTPTVLPVDPALVRRNVVISGLNLLALKNKRFRLGATLLEFTEPCQPCSAMEAALGRGGYNALRGHGGICARILEGGPIRIGDELVALDAPP
ncbi:MAG: MOSC domain-containing protein [Betaproteobacteria bacterium]|nr:MOSC domain-containing protein [Betaproteobacteria bacterium]